MDTQRSNGRHMTIGPHIGAGESHAVLRMNHRRHFLQIDLVHDAGTRPAGLATALEAVFE